MAPWLSRALLRPVPYLFSERGGLFLCRLLSRRLKAELCTKVTDDFLELLLKGMELSFCLSKDYRKNIKGFAGRYLFRTADDKVAGAAIFSAGRMEVEKEVLDNWDVRITCKDSAALRAFMFSKNQDILDSVLANNVEVDGNMNYMYKFGFMVRELVHKLGLN